MKEENKLIKISFEVAIVIIVVVIWSMILILEYGYSSYLNGKDSSTVSEEIINEPTNEVIDTNNIEESKLVRNQYEKYSDYEWIIKDNLKDNLEVKSNESLIQIKNSKLYIKNNDTKIEVKTMLDKPKCIFGFGTQSLEGVIIITEQGTVWEMDTTEDLRFEDNFYKIDFEDSVLDATSGGAGNRSNEIYFLLSNGNLVNTDGLTYEKINGNHILGLGYYADEIYVGADSTLSYYIDKTNYELVKDDNGNNVIANQVFVQTATSNNELVNYHVLDRFFIVTKDSKLFYFDDPLQSKIVTGKIYEKTAEKTVSKAYIDTVEERKDAIIVFTDGTKLRIKDIYDTFYDINDK